MKKETEHVLDGSDDSEQQVYCPPHNILFNHSHRHWHFYRTVKSESSAAGAGAAMHVFQALQYLRKLCTHPSLIMEPSHPDYHEVMAELAASKTTINDICYAPKLVALK